MLLSLMLAATSPQAQAQHITTIGEEMTVETGGAWTRLSPYSKGWHLFFAAGGDYARLPMSHDFVVEDVDRQRLTGMSHLDDHAIALCPDGKFFHIASGGTTTDNDSSYAFTYDDNLEIVESGAIIESASNLRFNDMPLLCNDLGQFTAFLDYGNAWPVFMELSRSGEIINEVTLGQLPIAEGSSLIQHPDGESIIFISSARDTRGLNLSILDTDFSLIDNLEISRMEPETRAHWPQGAIIIHDRLFVSYIRQKDSDDWSDDWGDLWLAIFDLEWNLLEDFVVVDTVAPDGAMRPSLTQSDRTLVVSYDRLEGGNFGDVSPRFVVMELDESLFPTQEDTGDTGDSGLDSDTSGCGCNSTGSRSMAISWLIAIALALLGRRNLSGQEPLASDIVNETG
jgi:hypothetical protein